MTRLIVEAGFGGTVADPANIPWTDISQYVDVVTGVSIGGGASDEVSEIQPATCSMVLDNDDGRFSSGRAAGAYYPNVKKNTPIRVRVVSTAKNLVLNSAFESDVSNWSVSGSQTIATSAVRAHDGTGSMLISWTAVSSQSVRTNVYGLSIGITHTASAWVWIPAGAPAVRLRAANPVTGTDLASGTASSVTDAWQQISVTWTSTLTWHQIRIGPTTTPTTGQQVWVDSVQVEEGPAVTAFDPGGAVIHDRFSGMVNEWPIKWKGLQSTVAISCTDLFKWLNRQPALRPLLVEDTLAARPLAYYPLSEPDSSVSAGDLAGGGATSLSVVQLGTGGTLAFAGGTAPAETGLACPLFTPASASAGMYLRGNLGLAAEAASSTYGNWLELWIQTTVTGRTFLALSSTDLTFQVIFGLQASTGLVEARYTQSGGPVSLFADWINLDSTNLADGNPHHLVIDEGGGVLYVDGVLRGNMNFGPQQWLRNIYVGGYTDGRLWSGSISHVAHYARSGMTAATLTPHYAAGAAGFAGESASARIQRLARYAGVAGVTSIGTTFDSQASQGPGGSTALAMMQAVASTESARLFADKGSFALKVMSRDVRYNPVAAVSLSYADLETDSLEMSDDDQKMVNTIVASRPGGATQRVVDQTARDTYGPYEQQIDILKTSDNSVLDAANWTVSRYADPPPELREIPVEAYSMGATTYRALLGLDISGVLTVTGLPDEAPSSTQTVYIEGYTETIKQGSHLISFHTSRSYNDSVWVLDDPTYSALGSTTRLAY